jgi:oxygen-independent coproporphyrinogen-3 oxidase
VKPISIYVHIPFCTVKCGYCDFNAYAGLGELKSRYREALLAEIAGYRELLRGREVATIGFGGGTPSEVPAADIGAVISKVASLAPLASTCEVSLEANPGTTSARQLRELRAAGVTRISFGAQSFDAGELAFLDRIHSPQATAASVRAARKAGFESVNLDLIYGLPGQAMESWERSLGQAIALGPDHISVYALTVEEGTPLALRVNRGKVEPLDVDLVAAMYERATDILAAAGYRQYELSNWARPGHESRHNRVYWSDGEYLGIGAGAHGYVGGDRYENIAHPRRYVETLEAGRTAVLKSYRPDGATAVFDWLTLALRLVDGFDPAAFRSRFGVGLQTVAGEPLSECAEAGLVEMTAGRVGLTRRGRLMHGEVAVRVLAHLQANGVADVDEALVAARPGGP